MKLRDVALELYLALVEDCGDPDDFPEDDGSVAVSMAEGGGDMRESAVTFALLRKFKAAINAD